MPLPNFRARTTMGMKSLADYRGNWLVLFSHPSDFTPVCTSEFVAIARAADRFARLGCALMALSVDSLYSHFAWIRMIHDRFGVKIEFPIIEDPTLEIARAYGMVAPDARDAATVRYSYFVDPQGILRASTCYPVEIGRSVEEMLRMVAALQHADRHSLLAPAEWTPGQPMLRPPTQEIDTVFDAGQATDWFYQLAGDDS
ncbi:peroxiredoxin [Sphingosinithalassobacter portus]|uniref:peroxiredoxin n=1 Tax=Stakelama portus TaxID=2676234 RepID=UPI000D6E4E56